jgi:hypothetical protein
MVPPLKEQKTWKVFTQLDDSRHGIEQSERLIASVGKFIECNVIRRNE